MKRLALPSCSYVMSDETDQTILYDRSRLLEKRHKVQERTYMDITITIPDTQWKEFQHVAQEAVEQSWNGKYEDFAIYIMTVNIDTYIESQKRKQEKKLKRALASYEASEAFSLSGENETKEADVLTERPDTAPPEEKHTPMTNKELSARIAQLQAIAVKKRTIAEVNELNNLLRMRKNKAKKK